MKRFVLISGVFMAMFFLASCDRNTVEPSGDSSTSSGARSASDSVKTIIAVADLPSTISTYITVNYAGATVSSAHSHSDGTIDVLITKADGTKAKLKFSAAGVFIAENLGKGHGKGEGKGHKGNSGGSTKTTIAQANLLPAITSYLNTNYAGYTFTNAYSEANAAGVVVYIDVDISLNNSKYHLVFDPTGTFVKVHTKK